MDDPRSAAEQAEALLREAIDTFLTTVESHKKELDASWRTVDGADTERLLGAVRRYRGLLDRLLEV